MQPTEDLPAVATVSPQQETQQQRDYVVVLLHGMWRTKSSMEPLRKHIEKRLGVRAVCIGYPTRPCMVELAQMVARDIRSAVAPCKRAFAVTHSLGGIVLRHIMDLPDRGGVKWAGCVMLAPPNHGSAVARRFNKFKFAQTVFRLATGPAGADLAEQITTTSTWPEPPKPCGVIAGTRSLALLNPTSWLTCALRLHKGRPHDGTVAVEEAAFGGMTDFATHDSDHTFIMQYREVMDLVVHFMQHSSFGNASKMGEASLHTHHKLLAAAAVAAAARAAEAGAPGGSTSAAGGCCSKSGCGGDGDPAAGRGQEQREATQQHTQRRQEQQVDGQPEQRVQ